MKRERGMEMIEGDILMGIYRERFEKDLEEAGEAALARAAFNSLVPEFLEGVGNE